MTALTWMICMVFGAAAMWVWPSSERLLGRLAGGRKDPRDPTHGRLSASADDPFAIALAFDLFAVCLRSGLPVETAALLTGRSAPPSVAVPLARTAELLTLGADPEQAWRATDNDHDPGAGDAEGYRALAALARRSGRSGASLADAVDELADATRRSAHDAALEAAERAGVAISGPLGLCFLPAFVCLGIVPVVIGLATTILST